MKNKQAIQIGVEGVAVVGMAGRFPNAANVDEFWRNLRDGVESITFFSEQELLQAGVDPTHLRAPNYVKAKGMLEGSDQFDADFFGFSPRDAEMMDPQRRIFLECAWQALETAGYCAENYDGAIGLFAGASVNTYLLNNLLPNRQLIDKVGNLQTSILNRIDHLSTRVAYELNLKGPAITVQTACSTSLVAVHLACQSLLNGECDMALAGGVTISSPLANGYFHQTGGIHSLDGHCRAFDANADGTVDGNGAGIVVLKRIEDAVADGDTISAIIRGSAINNDGSLKVGFTAPGVRGQVEVIAEAQAVAGVPAETITYIEAHGTGTTLGDPIEMEALTEVFQASTDKRKFCAVGSVKTNIGHLDVAAGVAGLIKTVLALKHRELPPSLHFQRPNPTINFEETPFFVNAGLRPWATNGEPLRAGISSFGIGGTNAHVIVEEAPVEISEESNRTAQLLVLSAKTATALDTATVNLISHFKAHPDANLADVAYTLQNGRKAFDYRRIAVCRDTVEATSILEKLDHRKVFTGLQEPHERPIVMMFPGQGSQYAGMGAKLYEHEAVFRREVDRCLEILQPQLGFDLRQVLFTGERAAEASERLKQTIVTQPALFVIEYALAQQWMSWGVMPAAMIGHSIGEYVAACVSGVIELEDALALVAMRGRLMQSLPPGAMLVLSMPEDEAQALLEHRELSVASVNAPSLCVVSGPTTAIDELEQELNERGIGSRRLHTSHAFHSSMMDSIVDEFVAEVGRVNLRAPQIPYLANLTGKWITNEEATDPQYWGRHLRECVQFNSGIVELFQDRDRVFLEVGPGRTLSTLLRHHPQKGTTRVVLSSLPHADERDADDVEYMLTTLGRLWLTGVKVEWSGLYEGERRRRVPLPAYPFDRQRYWIDPPSLAKKEIEGDGKTPARRSDIAEWFYVPSWKRVPNVHSLDNASSNGAAWLLFEDECGVSVELARQLRTVGRNVVTVKRGESFLRLDELAYTINPSERTDYVALINELAANGLALEKILYLWTITGTGTALTADELQQRSFYSPVYLVQALGEQAKRQPLQLYVVSDGMQEVTGEELLSPEKALALGPCRVIPQEYEHVSCRSVDVVIADNPNALEKLCKQLIAEAASDESDRIVAYRGSHRWVQTFEPLNLGATETRAPRLRERGVYLITGGLGGMALEFAQYLSREAGARLALVGRTPLPPRIDWDHWLTTQPDSDPTRRKIERVLALEALGTEVLILAADVADVAQLAAAVEQVRERFGPINGVIHTAGVPSSGVIQLMKDKTAAAVLAPKMRGARVIEEVFANTPLDFLVLCSSRSSILGGFGQTDYCAANAFLDAFAHDFAARTGTPAVSINWDAWTEVGMLVNTVAQFGMREGHAQRSKSETQHPLIDAPVSETPEQAVYTTHVNPTTHWVLDDHRIVGTAIMPGTAYFEMARAALERRENVSDDASTFEISYAFFLAPLGLRDDETREVQTILEKEGDAYQFRVRGQLPNENGGDPVWQDYALGQISLTSAEPPRRYDLEELRARCDKDEIVITDDYEMDPDLGPRWQSLRRVYLGENELLAELELPEEFADDFTQFKLHPALLDRATGTAKHYLTSGGHYLPMSYKRLTVKQPLPRKINAHIRFRDDLPHEQTITFDIILMDESGTESVVIDGFSQKRVNDTAEPLRALSAVKTAGASAPHKNKTDKPGVYQRAMIEGILPNEGIDAFNRILSNPLPPQVVVSARDLQTSITQMGAVTTADVIEEIGKIEVTRPATTHARPASLGAYAAPQNETERTLVEILQTMLGIEQVGIHDNFFELGGDSVLGIQIIAQAKRAGIYLTPQQIFQHPTVAEMAAIAANGQAETEAAAKVEEATQIDLSLTALDEGQMNKLMELIAEDEPETEQATIPSIEPVEIKATVASTQASSASHNGDLKRGKQLDFSIFFFAADNLRPGEDKYKLYIEGAKFADRNGFSALWTPERHFHESGGLYPNPSVLSAALATITNRIKLRAGSVVMPLHHSLRVAEEWAVVDNLSDGRAGVSFTSGWIPNDFAFFPERYANKREEMWRGIEEVQRLWRGDTINARDGKGNSIELKVLPRPIQPELPIWITCSGDPEMFVSAGERGFNILTALLTQSVDEVATRIASYRQALAKHGHDPATRQVTLMLHTFVGPDLNYVLSKARTPLCNYLKAHVGLIETMTRSLNIKVGIDQEYVDDLVAFAFERYYQTASLIGTPEKCLPLIDRLKQIGVDEVACFIDFGVDTASVLDSLHHLSRLRELSEQTSEPKHLVASI